MIRKFLEVLKRPFRTNLSIFISLLILLIAVDIFFYFRNGSYAYCFYIFSQGFVLSYIITFFLAFFRGLSKKIIGILVFVSLIILSILDLFCVTNYNVKFDDNFAGIVMATNIGESVEFIRKYVTLEVLVITILFILFIIGCFYLVRKLFSNSGIITNFSIIILLISCIAVSHNPDVLKDGLVGKIDSLRAAHIPSLSNNLNRSDLIVIKDERPSNFVIIIGESFTKAHSSLYGYDKKTNPYLGQLEERGNLFVFNNVVSPATHTIEAFKYILNTCTPESSDSINWYNCPSIPEVANLMGYRTLWFSNQSENGLMDNIAGAYAKICSNKYFTRKKYARGGWNTYDEALLELAEPIIDKDTTNFIFFHLLGSHPDFSKRYPHSYNYFSKDDYIDKPVHQRENYSQYDNSVLYNDFVINNIISYFSDRDAVVIYFSDHGLDFYGSRDNYAGHAIIGNPVSQNEGIQIPFMIYLSEQYAEKHPDIIQSLTKNKYKHYRTDKLIWTVMDFLNVRFFNDSKIEDYSILR